MDATTIPDCTSAASSFRPLAVVGSRLCYELRFRSLFNQGRGYAFPCDSAGHVDIDELAEPARSNYFYARTCIGRDFFAPVVLAAQRH